MYEKSGGKKYCLNFFYRIPTLLVEYGMRKIQNEFPDFCLVDLQNAYRGLEVPIEIFVEEDEGRPVQVMDREHMIPIQEKEILQLLDGISFDEGDGESGARDESGKNASGRVRNEVEGVRDEGEKRKGERDEGEKRKRKRVVSERFIESSSEFDDSSDEDYRQPEGEKSEFDAPSVVLEDIEDISDEDIFLNKNPSKTELMKKLKMLKKMNKQKMREQAKLN
ncbi:UNVERIFIED_CONTAM: hypothetical protein Sradi_3630000 [Sesamum radiatum]|uniref:Uncharacterized protein n=1 Tax=Sesamum radiatum TaxID=300843 RepID=A0AAW2QHX2_SESRA